MKDFEAYSLGIHTHNHGHGECDHNHGHHHHHHHHSHHGNGDSESRLRSAFLLNLSFALIEIFGAIVTNSVSILADALHDFGDSLALALAWGMQRLAGRGRDDSFSYGYTRFSMLAAVINSVVLLFGSVAVIGLAVWRLIHPEPVEANGMIVFAVLGVAVNGFAALRLHRHGNLNEQMAFWHLLEDALGWVAVFIGAIAIKIWGWTWLDPVLCIAIACFISFNVFRRFIESLKVLLQAVPGAVSIARVSETLSQLPDVIEAHHVQLWSLDGLQHVCTAHVVVPADYSRSQMIGLKVQAKEKLKSLQVQWLTLEFEFDGEDCRESEVQK